MSWYWTTAGYFVAGAVLAAVPIALHLLKRRHARQIAWGPMHLLRRAVTRQRRWLLLRDRLLLALRMLAVLAFGCALARPRTTLELAGEPAQPAACLLLVDNSLSMTYRHLGKSRLDVGLEKAAQLIKSLPSGTMVAALPVCGNLPGGRLLRYQSADEITLDPRLFPAIDAQADFPQLNRRLQRALAQLTPAPSRIYLFTDQQASNWARWSQDTLPDNWPPLHVVDAGSNNAANAWVQAVHVWPPVLGNQQELVVYADIAATGPNLPDELLVRLELENQQVAVQRVATPQSGQVTSVVLRAAVPRIAERPADDALHVRVALPADLLPADDQQSLLVPWVAPSAVVCVDQYGADRERIDEGLIGSTYGLRRLLAAFGRPVGAHMTVDQLSRQWLEEARLVVLAGVRAPVDATPLLREFLVQGGQLLIATSDAMDIEAWNSQAWNGGDGILPLPLENAAADLAATPRQLQLDQDIPELLRIAGLTSRELVELAREPLVLRMLPVRYDAEVLDALRAREQQRWEEALRRGVLRVSGPAIDVDATYGVSRWLLWSRLSETNLDNGPLRGDRGLSEFAAELAERQMPVVLARLDDESPLIVERRVGRGRVVWFGSTIEPQWNTWATTNAVLLWQQVMDRLVADTLPPRHFAPGESLAVSWAEPSAAADAERATYQLLRPSSKSAEPISARQLGPGQWRCVCRDAWESGIYQIRRASDGETVWRFTVGGRRDLESNLTKVDEQQFAEKLSTATGSRGGVTTGTWRGDGLWWYFMWLVLVLLVTELAFLAWKRPTAPQEAPA